MLEAEVRIVEGLISSIEEAQCESEDVFANDVDSRTGGGTTRWLRDLCRSLFGLRFRSV